MATTTTVATTSSVVMIALGIASTILSREFDSFIKGLFQGAGIALIVLGVVVLSARSRLRAREKSDWLPSRDNAE